MSVSFEESAASEDSTALKDSVTFKDSVSFEEMVTAATVGVSRRPLALTGTTAAKPDGDPATALLDAVALEVVARRAGYQPARGVTPPDAPAENAPALSPRAARALREACGWQAGRFPVDNLLLPDLLTAAADAGYVAHPLLLPGLLDAAVRRTALRPPVTAVLGARGRWLARHRADWHKATSQASTADGADTTGGPRVAAVSQDDAEKLAALLPDMPLNTVNPPGWGISASPGGPSGGGPAGGGGQGSGQPRLDAITGWPGPWPEVLAEAVLAVFGRVWGLAVLPSGARMLLTAAGRGLPATGPADYAARLNRMADACPHAWVTGLRAAAETVLLRRVFLTEIGRG